MQKESWPRRRIISKAWESVIYSMEELAYFLYENIYLVDKRMLGTSASGSGCGTEMH